LQSLGQTSGSNGQRMQGGLTQPQLPHLVHVFAVHWQILPWGHRIAAQLGLGTALQVKQGFLTHEQLPQE